MEELVVVTGWSIQAIVKSKKSEDIEELSVDIQRTFRKQNVVKKWIVEMAKEGLISFDEYYNMFVYSIRFKQTMPNQT